MSKRRKVIAANWKMFKTVNHALDFIAALRPIASAHERDDIVLCPPFTCIPAVVDAVKGAGIFVGGQNMFWEKEGPYTGEISAGMLVAAGCSHVIIGHSERRQYFGETDDTVNLKLKSALAAGLKPILCVGEVIQEREAGLTGDVLRRQCSIAFREISSGEAIPMVIAYEPVWAIGTGKTATPEMASDAHEIIRGEVIELFGEGVGGQIRILYGGSVKPDNVTALMAKPEIDGALVGGASLDPKSFAAILKY
jgi:triosephosphate isomerase (TIM)